MEGDGGLTVGQLGLHLVQLRTDRERGEERDERRLVAHKLLKLVGADPTKNNTNTNTKTTQGVAGIAHEDVSDVS